MCLVQDYFSLFQLFLLFGDRAERRYFFTKTLLIHSPFLLLSFFEGVRKGEKNNQSRGKKIYALC